MSGPCTRPECGGEVHTDPWGVPAQCPRAEPETAIGCVVLHRDAQGNATLCPGYPHAQTPRRFAGIGLEGCPHCDEPQPEQQMDAHVSSVHADLPPCTARIEPDHGGLYTCAFRVGHKNGEHGNWHASARGAMGRYVWNDGAPGATPCKAPEPDRNPSITAKLSSGGPGEGRSPAPKADKPRASVIEIIATGRAPAEDGAGSIIVPREVRINGVSVFTADRQNRIKVSDINLGDDMVEVTVTLIARRLVIAADGDLPHTEETTSKENEA